MARVIFDGLTVEQAKEFAHWFEGQGEQDIVVWFESQDPAIEPPQVDVDAGPKWLEREGDDFVVRCCTP